MSFKLTIATKMPNNEKDLYYLTITITTRESPRTFTIVKRGS